MAKRITASITVWLVASLLGYYPQDSLRAQATLQNTLPYEQPKAVQEADDAFFKSEEVLQFKLVLNYKELLKDRGEEREYHQATLTYQDKSGAVVPVKLKVMVRGNRRRDPSVCDFPPLLLNLSRKTTANTAFHGLNKLKLVTHCINDDYVIREYLVYKLYNVLDENSFRVRLCQVAYEDAQGKRKPEKRYAFLIEDDGDMAKRQQASIVPPERVLYMDNTDGYTMAKLALFQYMIGNTDWSVPYRHNIKLLVSEKVKLPVPVPYDFDYSGIVAAPYAKPPPELGITTVRQRLYRGYRFPDKIYREVINFYNIHREDIYQVYTGCDLLDKKYRKQTLNYLNSFYKTINSPKDFRTNIVRVGQENQKSYVTVKGL